MNYDINCLSPVKNDWYHNWCLLSDSRLKDYVKGPLKFPMVLVSIPYIIEGKDGMDQCDCTQRIKKCYSKPGIPDPWDEYLIFRREAERGMGVAHNFPKQDLDITRALNENYRIYLGQGIPDPWKKLIHLQPLEPSFDNLRKNWKNCLGNLRKGTGCDMYDTEKVCCPNCSERLLVLCPKKTREKEKEVDEEVNTDPQEPFEEKPRIYLKDACVETESLLYGQKGDVKISKKCECSITKINKCPSCPVCNGPKKENKTVVCRSKENDSCCKCGKNTIREDTKCGCPYHAGTLLKSKRIEQAIPRMDQGDFYSKINYQRPILPFFCNSYNNCGCSPQQFIGFEEKNDHGLELRLICPKCDRKRRGATGKFDGPAKLRKQPYLPCHCEEMRRKKRETDISYDTCKRSHVEERYKSNMTYNTDDRPRYHCDEERTTKSFQKSPDYLRMLEMLGFTDFYPKNLNTVYDEPETSDNKKRDTLYSSVKKQIPRRTGYYSHCSVDEFRKMRRQKHKDAFKKERNNLSKNDFSNDSES